MNSPGLFVGPVRVVVLGCGYWGRNLVRNFHALGVLVAVVDSSAAGCAAAAAAAPGVPVFASLGDALPLEPNAAVIATPACTHVEQALKALSYGLHVFVEKPLALSLEEGRRLTEAAVRAGLILQVGHLLEYHPAFTALRDGISRLGRLTRIQSHRTNWGKVRTEEDALWSLAPHDVSMILRLVGRLPQRVSCTGTLALGTVRADAALAVLHFSDGFDAHILCSWIHPFKEHRLVVTGQLGAAVFDDTQPREKLVWYPQWVEWLNGQPCLHRDSPIVQDLPPDEPLRLECHAFVQSITSGSSPIADATAGLRVVAVLEACQRSMRVGGSPVQVEAP